MSRGFKILVEGDYACYSRPELKVERVSYDVPTPGALEGMLKSVYWKPAIRYVIDRIVVFQPIEFANIRRNEVKDKVLLSAVKKQMKGKEADPCIYTSEKRNQRAAMVLKNVKYGVEFHFELTGLKSDNEDEGEKKHYNIIKRRLEKGTVVQDSVPWVQRISGKTHGTGGRLRREYDKRCHIEDGRCGSGSNELQGAVR